MQVVAGDGRSQFEVLLDHVRAVCGDALGEKPARGAFAWLGLADERRQPAMRPRIADRTAPWRSSTASYSPARRVCAQGSDLAAGFAVRRAAPPILVGARWRRSTMRLLGAMDCPVSRPELSSAAKKRAATAVRPPSQ